MFTNNTTLANITISSDTLKLIPLVNSRADIEGQPTGGQSAPKLSAIQYGPRLEELGKEITPNKSQLCENQEIQDFYLYYFPFFFYTWVICKRQCQAEFSMFILRG